MPLLDRPAPNLEGLQQLRAELRTRGTATRHHGGRYEDGADCGEDDDGEESGADDEDGKMDGEEENDDSGDNDKKETPPAPQISPPRPPPSPPPGGGGVGGADNGCTDGGSGGGGGVCSGNDGRANGGDGRGGVGGRDTGRAGRAKGGGADDDRSGGGAHSRGRAHQRDPRHCKTDRGVLLQMLLLVFPDTVARVFDGSDGEADVIVDSTKLATVDEIDGIEIAATAEALVSSRRPHSLIRAASTLTTDENIFATEATSRRAYRV